MGEFQRSVRRWPIAFVAAILVLTIHVSRGFEKPNFVVILTDDLGYGDLGCYGAEDIATQRIDQMAAEGIRFTSFYVSPVCSPTRASLMTGCYAQRVGIGGVLFERNTVGLHHDEVTLPELLGEQGYATALIGKWHLGFQSGQHPPHHGFDYWYGTIASNSAPFSLEGKLFSENCYFRDGLARDRVVGLSSVPCALMRDEEVVEIPADQAQFTRRYTEEVIRHIRANKSRPFFIYLAHNMPHIPLHASEGFRGTSERGLYGDVIEELDWSVGEILDVLHQEGLDEKTMVILTSDNGPKRSVGGSAGGLRGEKGSSFEGGVRVPFIARWPGKVPADRVTEEPVAVMDLLPTLVGLAGGRVSTAPVIDGKDIWPLLSGRKGAKSPHQAIYFLKGRFVKGVRVGDWKFLVEDLPEGEESKAELPLSEEELELPRRKRNALIKERRKADSSASGPVVGLYDVRQDAAEQRNRIGEFPDVATRLREMVEVFQNEIRANHRPAGRGE
ncbi:MAG: sulfatase [Verrucomicrobiota bacterium]